MIDTATYQRLRYIKQLGLGHVTYPNATHTRFAHSLGAFAIMARILDSATEKLKLCDRDIEDLRLAALLHDIGHYPYSHLMEGVEKVELTEEFLGGTDRTLRLADCKPYPDHEKLGHAIVCSQKDLIEAIGGKNRARRIADIFTKGEAAPDRLSRLIHSSLDMDRLDYLVRDARAAGVPYGEVDLDYLLHHVRVSPSGMIGIDYKALAAAEQFLLARWFMHRTVYFHKTTFGLEEALRQLIRRCRDKEKEGVPSDGEAVLDIVSDPKRLLAFTDSFLDRIAHTALYDNDRVIAALAKAVVLRRPPKLLREECSVVSDVEAEQQRRNDCTAFREKCFVQLRSLAKKHKVKLGQFLLATPRTLRLEKRGGLITLDQANAQLSEPKDELIKVFVRGEEEPRSLVDIPESLLRICAHHSFWTIRLYVVEQDEAKVQKMKKEVQAW